MWVSWNTHILSPSGEVRFSRQNIGRIARDKAPSPASKVANHVLSRGVDREALDLCCRLLDGCGCSLPHDAAFRFGSKNIECLSHEFAPLGVLAPFLRLISIGFFSVSVCRGPSTIRCFIVSSGICSKCGLGSSIMGSFAPSRN